MLLKDKFKKRRLLHTYLKNAANFNVNKVFRVLYSLEIMIYFYKVQGT